MEIWPLNYQDCGLCWVLDTGILGGSVGKTLAMMEKRRTVATKKILQVYNSNKRENKSIYNGLLLNFTFLL